MPSVNKTSLRAEFEALKEKVEAVYDLAQAIRIRTGETGPEAL